MVPCLMCSCHAINAAKWQMQNELHTRVNSRRKWWMSSLIASVFCFRICKLFSCRQIVFQGRFQQKSLKYLRFYTRSCLWQWVLMGKATLLDYLSLFFCLTFPYAIALLFLDLMGNKLCSFYVCKIKFRINSIFVYVFMFLVYVSLISL